MREIATGEGLKEYLRELEQDPDDLIGEGEDPDAEYGRLNFGWKRSDKKYRLTNGY